MQRLYRTQSIEKYNKNREQKYKQASIGKIVIANTCSRATCPLKIVKFLFSIFSGQKENTLYFVIIEYKFILFAYIRNSK